MAKRCRFAECESCINKEFDPFRCETCVDGSNFEGEDDVEELSYHEFLDLMKESV